MPQEIKLMRCINVTARCGMRFREDRLRDEGISGAQCHYLLYIFHHPAVSQDELAQALYVNKSNVTRQLSALEQNGLIVRTADERDKRVLRTTLTDKALELMPKVHQALNDWNDLLTEDFSPEEKEQLSRLMLRVKEKATAYVATLQEEKA